MTICTFLPSASRLPIKSTLVLLLALAFTGCADDRRATTPRRSLRADIFRTPHGIPHIRATDDASLGYGIGFVQAEDGQCALAEQFVTVAGNRARYFGQGRSTPQSVNVPANLSSDIFFRLLNDDDSISAVLSRQHPQVAEVMRGWVAGYNRYLRETATSAFPTACRRAAWVQPITVRDVARLMRFYDASDGILQLKGAIASAQPPISTTPGIPPAIRTGAMTVLRDRSDVGTVLSNVPPKHGATSKPLRGTFHTLRLDPANATNYLVNGQSRPMSGRTVQVAVKERSGALRTERRTFYTSEFGWIVAWKADGTAIAFDDALPDSHRLVDEWYSVNRARTLAYVNSGLNDTGAYRAVASRVQPYGPARKVGIDADPGQRHRLIAE